MPWKSYNPKLAMPQHYAQLSEWGIVIPTSDEVAWTVNKDHNWVYNKLAVAASQNIPCGPVGAAPTEYPVIIKPITNLSGGGIGAFVCHTTAEYSKIVDAAGCFWSRYAFGNHYSIDLIVLNGEVQLSITFVGEKLQLGLFDYWHLVETPADLLVKLQQWVDKHLFDYTGCLNVEVIGTQIIEAHLRFGDLDRLGDTDLLEAIHVLYNAHTWTYNKILPKSFYIAALFGQHDVNFTINVSLANNLFKHLTYFQLDSSNVEPMGKPINGQRLALFCDSSLQSVTESRNIAIALFSPDIDGKYTDTLTNYCNLRI